MNALNNPHNAIDRYFASLSGHQANDMMCCIGGHSFHEFANFALQGLNQNTILIALHDFLG